MGRDVTELLGLWRSGDAAAGEQVMELLYDKVRQIAAHEFRRERADHTLQPTAIAHEALIRLAKGGVMDVSSRSHFLAITARVIRQVLVDYSRERGRRKRGGDQVRVELAEGFLEHVGPLDFVDLDRAMTKLKQTDADAAAVVELKFIGGLTEKEIADYRGISKATVSRKWAIARAWLRGELEPTGE